MSCCCGRHRISDGRTSGLRAGWFLFRHRPTGRDVQLCWAWYIAVDGGRRGCVVVNSILPAEQLARAKGATIIDVASFGHNMVAHPLIVAARWGKDPAFAQDWAEDPVSLNGQAHGHPTDQTSSMGQFRPAPEVLGRSTSWSGPSWPPRKSSSGGEPRLGDGAEPAALGQLGAGAAASSGGRAGWPG